MFILMSFQKCIDCSKECPGKTIRTLEGLRSFEGCTRITGDLTIQINGSKLKTFAGICKKNDLRNVQQNSLQQQSFDIDPKIFAATSMIN